MDKYQEALNKLIYCANQISCSYCKFRDTCVGTHKFTSLLQELVDKATPKKTIYIDTTLCILSHFICPVCRTKVNPNGLYCDNCGQPLDWSDEDDK